jgi:hypothetical protein
MFPVGLIQRVFTGQACRLKAPDGTKVKVLVTSVQVVHHPDGPSTMTFVAEYVPPRIKAKRKVENGG